MEYLVGSKKDFLNYLNKIEKKDRIAVITHNDLDGIASAILIDEILKNKNAKIKSLNFITYKKGMFGEFEKKFNRKKIKRIFISDVNIDSDYEGFENLRKKFDVFLVDHHPSNAQGGNLILTKTNDCATFAIYELAKDDFDLEKWKWLVFSTMVSEFSYKDISNFNFLKKNYPTITLDKIMDSEPGEMSKKISSALIYFKGKEKKVFDLIQKNKIRHFEKYFRLIEKEIKCFIEKFREEAEFYPERNLYFYYASPKLSITSITTTILSMENPDKSLVFISDIENEPDFLKVSSRNQSGKEDMNLLMKKGIEGLENATGGGHTPAAGAKFMKKDLEKFKKNLLN